MTRAMRIGVSGLVITVFGVLVVLASRTAGISDSTKTPEAAGGNVGVIGAFVWVRKTDEMSDADDSFITSEDVKGRTLSWSCYDKTRLHVVFGHDAFLAGRLRVDVRFPPAPSSRDFEPWGQNPTGRSAYLLETRQSGESGQPDVVHGPELFTEKGLQAGTVILRAWDSDFRSVTATFSLEGLNEALKKLPCSTAFFAGQRASRTN